MFNKKSKGPEKSDEQKALEEHVDQIMGEIPDDDGLDNKANNDAVDDIVARESDKLLAIDDALAARRQRRLDANKPKPKRFLGNKLAWAVLIALLVLLWLLLQRPMHLG